MSTPAATGEFLFLMRGTEWGGNLSPREVQESMEAMGAWIDDLKARGILKAGQPLATMGTVVSERQGSVMDGPFVESKEAVGGYLLLQTETFEEAVQAARDCPVLKHGLYIEVRPMLAFCSMMEETGVMISAVPV